MGLMVCLWVWRSRPFGPLSFFIKISNNGRYQRIPCTAPLVPLLGLSLLGSFFEALYAKNP
jgi:hypothetical protein